MELLKRLSDTYNVGISRILDGPDATELPWEEARRRYRYPPAPMLTPDELRKSRRNLWNAPALLNYLRQERGFSRKTIRDYKLGYFQPDANRPPGFVIPMPLVRPVTFRIRYWPDLWVPPGTGVHREWSAAAGCYIETRTKVKPVKIATPRGHQQRIYPYRPTGRAVLLTEGEFDCLLARQHGFRAVGVPGMMSKAHLLRMLARRVPRVYVCFDQGADEAAQRALNILRGQGAEAWSVDLGLPRNGQDVTDFLLARTAAELKERIREARCVG